VLMCGWSSALLIGFGVSVWPNAKRTLEDSWVEYIESKIIYHITERIEKIVTGMLDPKEIEVTLCEANVWGIFYTSKQFLIVGLQIKWEESMIENKALVRVMRKDKFIGKWKIESLKQWVEEVNKIEGPTECGIKLTGITNVELWDTLEVYKLTIQK
jgi:translation initiation factor IF-2